MQAALDEAALDDHQTAQAADQRHAHAGEDGDDQQEVREEGGRQGEGGGEGGSGREGDREGAAIEAEEWDVLPERDI